VLKVVREMREAPEEFEGLERALSDTYFCNFSMFQSLPDIWAIDQLFPIMPIHRLAEEPTRRAVLADITCDSDGKIDHFIDRRDVKNVLELHPYSHGEGYFLGVFLAGAYQEILGDLHNLFGNTNTVHVSLAPGGGYQIEHVVTGDTVTDVLKYVSYARDDLMARVRRFAEQAVRSNGMSLEETRSLLRMYEEGLSGYTYLERG
jgi:arginine decarboxylase